MSKEIEALYRIHNGYKDGYYRQFADSEGARLEDVKVIEQALTEHEALKHDIAIYKETLNSIKTICNEHSPSMTLSLVEKSNRYIEIDNLVNTYDEKLRKVNKQE